MQYDVYANPSARMREQYPNVVDLQSDILRGLPTRLVCPLSITSLAGGDIPHRLCPAITVQGRRLLLMPFVAAPLDKRLLRTRLASVKDHADEIVAAVDAVLGGV